MQPRSEADQAGGRVEVRREIFQHRSPRELLVSAQRGDLFSQMLQLCSATKQLVRLIDLLYGQRRGHVRALFLPGTPPQQFNKPPYSSNNTSNGVKRGTSFQKLPAVERLIDFFFLCRFEDTRLQRSLSI